ncbi:hypothetical protein, partial [Burkholderia multivorans]|uniref:hypothetical protein n=1 Tax=Burkholderia multivorans TaxID=87883 RepID=UPI001E425D50
SADLSAFAESARGLSTLWLIYRRWGISPRPENKQSNYNAIDYRRQCISFKHLWFIGADDRTTMSG